MMVLKRLKRRDGAEGVKHGSLNMRSCKFAHISLLTAHVFLAIVEVIYRMPGNVINPFNTVTFI